MIRDLGIVEPGTTLYIPFHTFDSNDPSASVTLTGLAVTDVEIYKDGSVTQRASDNGYALLDTDGIDFDALTGIHGLSINLADNSTAGFYAAGSQYWVVIASITVDAATVNFVLATFRIGQPNAIVNTTIATLSTQTSFTLTVGPAEDDALNGLWAIIHDVASAVQKTWVQILDYTGSTKTVTLVAGGTFTVAATDNISVMFPMPVQPTVMGRTLDVSTGGEAGLDWANIGSPTTAQNLSATNIDVDQVVASVSGAVGSVTGAVGSVTGAVGSVAAGGITASSIAADAIGASELAADAVTEIANAVWDTDATGRQTQGTFGQAIGDPVADTNTIYKAVVTDAAGANVAADVVAVKADTAAIKLKTDNLPADPADASDLAAAIAALNDLSAAEVTTEIEAALALARVEVSGVPAASASIVVKLGYLYMALRNKLEITSTAKTFSDDSGAAEWKKTLSDDGTTYSESEAAAP